MKTKFAKLFFLIFMALALASCRGKSTENEPHIPSLAAATGTPVTKNTPKSGDIPDTLGSVSGNAGIDPSVPAEPQLSGRASVTPTPLVVVAQPALNPNEVVSATVDRDYHEERLKNIAETCRLGVDNHWYIIRDGQQIRNDNLCAKAAGVTDNAAVINEEKIRKKKKCGFWKGGLFKKSCRQNDL